MAAYRLQTWYFLPFQFIKMVTTDIEYIYRQIETVPCVYWTVKESEVSRQYLAKQSDEITPEESVARLSEVLKSTNNGTLFITISKRAFVEIQKAGDKYGDIFKFNVRVNNRNQPAQTQVSPSLGSVVPVNQYLDEVRVSNGLRLDVFRLEQEIQQLKSAKSDTWMNMLSPAIEKLAANPRESIAAIGSLFRAPVPPSPISRPVESYENWPDSDKINAALHALKKIEPDLGATLMDMATALNKYPELLPAFKENIKTAINS